MIGQHNSATAGREHPLGVDCDDLLDMGVRGADCAWRGASVPEKHTRALCFLGKLTSRPGAAMRALRST